MMITKQPPSPARTAFTLIEMMIVVSLLGILSTVVMEVAQNQSRIARKIATEETVARTSQAITLFRQETGQLPNLISGWDPLTRTTTQGGVTVGPFLNGPPKNQLVAAGQNPSCITDGNTATLYLDQCSFLYDYDGGAGTGRFIASFTARPTTLRAAQSVSAVVRAQAAAGAD